VKTVIFDENEIIRIGLLTIFNHNSDMIVIDAFGKFDDFLSFVSHNNVELIFADFFQYKNFNFDFLKKIKSRNKETKIVVFTNVLDKTKIFSAIKAGVDGYVHKNSTKDEIFKAVDVLKKNEQYFSENVSDIILKTYLTGLKQGEEISEKKPRDLTKREIQILKLVCQGLTNQQIADGLYISIRTVETHKTNIMQKLKLQTTADLIKFAFQNGYITM